MFRRFLDRKTFTLNRVRDRITVREGSEEITLTVDADARVIVTRIRKAQEQLVKANQKNADIKAREQAARAFAEAMFGTEQTDSLARFYHDDYSCVLMICGLYFEKRLCKKITKAQKKLK